MERFNALFKKTKELLTVRMGLESEDEAVTFAQFGLEAGLNHGRTSGMGRHVRIPEESGIGCFGAQPIYCDPDNEYRQGISTFCHCKFVMLLCKIVTQVVKKYTLKWPIIPTLMTPV